jgi:hypothetical protein
MKGTWHTAPTSVGAVLIMSGTVLHTDSPSGCEFEVDLVGAMGGWHTFIRTPPSHPCHGLPALRMPVCLRAPPVRTPDPPHPARLPTQPRLCARPSRNRNLAARISNFFFSLPSKHLRPKKLDFQQTCARAPRHTGVYMEGHTNASDRLRPRSHQTHPSRQRRHADSLVQPRPALLPGPLVVAPTAHRRSTRRSARQSAGATCARTRTSCAPVSSDQLS